MKRIAWLFLLALLTAPRLVAAQAQDSTAENAAVRQVIARYLHGLKFNDVSDFREAFWPEAKLLFTRKDGSLGQLTQEQWYQMFEGSAGKEEQGDLRIADMEVHNDIAVVKVVEEYPGSRYTDYISLVKFGGRWWIVNKVYNAERR